MSQSWFYKWKAGALPPRAARRERLKAQISRLFRHQEGTYGAPRITADLRDAGWSVSENTVAALMRQQGLAARHSRRRRSTTRPSRGRWRAPDLVKRDFTTEQINQKWYGDATEIHTGEGTLHLASILDMGLRRVVGFALFEHHNAALAYGALAMAVAVRGGSVPGVIMHTVDASARPCRQILTSCR
jgi:transposase InsO family protein